MAAPQRDVPRAVAEPGWRRPRLAPSLAEVYRTVPVSTGAWWRKALAFAGPGYLVAVGYMDPGNWATDLAGGSRDRWPSCRDPCTPRPRGSPGPRTPAPCATKHPC